MKEIEKHTLNKALVLLNALKVQYKVITAEGDEYGELEVVHRSGRKVTRRVKTGTYRDLFTELLSKTPVGGVEQFSLALVNTIEGSSPELFRSALTAHASALWGVGNYTSTITDTDVEILRLA